MIAQHLLFLFSQVIAQAYDNPIPGYKTPTVGNLRLWDALPVTEFDLAAFNAGDYDKVTDDCCLISDDHFTHPIIPASAL